MAQLETPNITLTLVDRTSIRIGGLAVAHALGYQVRISTLAGGGVPEKVTPVDGVVEFANRSPRTVYYVSARALGDDELYSNSDWTDEQTVQTGTDVDQELDVPNLGAVSESFTTVAISGLTAYKEYRVQIATSVAALDDAVPRVIGSGDGSARLMGLEPGTSYFVRACLVDGDRCSLWSDVVSAVTSEISATVEVTSGNDSGTGTLRQAISDAADGTKIILKVSSITLNTLISTAKRLFIVGGLADRTVISAGNGNGLFTGAYLDFRHVAFTGTIGSNRVINSAARLDDCLVYDVVGTGNSGYLSDARIYRSICRGNTAARNNLAACMIYDSVIDTNTATSKSSVDGGGGAYNASVSNCTIVGNIANYGGGAYNSTLTSCTITGNTASSNGGGVNGGNVTGCLITGNTASTGGGVNGGNVTGCLITGNTASTGGGASGGTLTSCTITGNTASTGGGVKGGTGQAIDTCLVYGNTKPDQTPEDFYHTINAACTIRSSTIGTIYHNKPTYIEMYNTLYQTLSEAPTAGNANNLSYAGLEDDYFVDAAAGDYRLKYGALAIDAGDNQYVQATRDLAGNPRIGGTTVDVGAYEFEPYKLPAPEFEIAVLPGGQATVTYTLPPLASGFCLQYADNDAFINAQEITSSSTGIALTGMSGRVYFRAKSLGTAGQTEDSDWTETKTQYFDVTGPIVIVDQTPIVMTVYETVDLLAGVVVTDDSGEVVTPHYQVLDGSGQAISVDGQTVDVRTSGIPVGDFTLQITATDSVGNVGTATRPLAVLPPKLDTPTLTMRSLSGSTVVLAGLANYFATGWQLDHNGAISSVTPDAAGYIAIEGLTANVTHTFRARALGDWNEETASGDHRDSDWSNAIAVTIVPPAPQLGLFYKWESDIELSHSNRILQNLQFRAKITDSETGDVLPSSAVTGATFYGYRVIPNGVKTVITGFNGLTVPVSSFSDILADDGYNVHYIPEQTSPVIIEAGLYMFEIKVTLSSGNPFSILSKVMKVY